MHKFKKRIPTNPSYQPGDKNFDYWYIFMCVYAGFFAFALIVAPDFFFGVHGWMPFWKTDISFQGEFFARKKCSWVDAVITLLLLEDRHLILILLPGGVKFCTRKCV